MGLEIAVVGAGSWGTSLADHLAKKGHQIRLWSHDPEVAGLIEANGENTKYLSGIKLSPRVVATSDLEVALKGAEVVLSVTPSQYVRDVMGRAAEFIDRDALLISASKGIETSTLKTMAEVFEDLLPSSIVERAAYLSGPSFALEVAREEPTAVAVASHSPEAAEEAQALFQTEYFRVYTNPDVKGVELGGALKNVIALAAGMTTGLGLGHNSLAALITRGLAEMSRLGVALGASPLTFSGLAGMGDLILTCTGGLSRNRSVGVALGEGRSLSEILEGMTMVVEGVETARATHALAERTGTEMPIVDEVYAVLFEDRSVGEAVENLMLRTPKAEHWQ